MSLPTGSTTVSVKIIKAYDSLASPAGHTMWSPPAGGEVASQMFDGSGFSFLVEHPSGRRLIFDLGYRHILESTPPAIRTLMEAGIVVGDTKKDVTQQLVEGGIPLESIEAFVWSHAHFDHTGDPSLWPSSVKLIMGEGTQAHARPAYPINPDSHFQESDFEGREVEEVSCKGPKIGGFASHDYFGDGSFYLLDTPGHCVGHLAGFARVTPSTESSPGTFIFMGGDIVHHPALLRPNRFSPLPKPHCDGLKHCLRRVGAPEYKTPFLAPPAKEHAGHHDLSVLGQTVRHLQEIDSKPEVWVVVAHDTSLGLDTEGKGEGVALFPQTANDWKAKGWKDKYFWAFLEDGNKANQWADAN